MSGVIGEVPRGTIGLREPVLPLFHVEQSKQSVTDPRRFELTPRIRCSDPNIGIVESSKTSPGICKTALSATVVKVASRPPGLVSLEAAATACSMRSTARRVTQSNCSSRFSALPASTRASSWRLRTTSRRKAAFLFCDSAKVTLISGRQIAIGTPGNPAPLPKSRTVAIPTGKAWAPAIDSTKWRLIIPPASRIAVRFILAFHRRIRSR